MPYTQTPWLVHPVTAHIVPAADLFVPVCALLWPTDDRTEAETLANAEFICTAVNAHAALVASLTEMLEVYWGEGDGIKGDPACIKRAKAALEAAQP